MALQSIPGFLWIPTPYPSSGAGQPTIATSSTTLSTANSRFAMIFQVPKTGTLDWFEVRAAVVSNNPDNGLRFSFQDINSSGNPDGTEDQYTVLAGPFTSNTWIAPSSYMGASGSGSGAKRSVTKGDWLCCVVRFENFVASDSMGFATLDTISQVATPSPSLKYLKFSTDGGASYTFITDRAMIIGLKYDDGSYAVLGMPDMPALTINTRTFNSGSTPDERGLLFQLPFPARVYGAWVRIDLDNACDIILYDGSNSVLTSYSAVSGQRILATGTNFLFVFPASISLSRNTNYRLVVKPTTGSNVSIYDVDVNAAALLGAMDGGTNWLSTSRTDAGVWNNTDTNRPLMGLVLDAFDDAVSGGGGETSAVF